MGKQKFEIVKFTIYEKPVPKQSARFSIIKGKNGKHLLHKYQKKTVKDNEKNLKAIINTQLPPNFALLTEAIGIRVLFVYAPLKSLRKAEMEILKNGGIIYKPTRPDLTDNLMKGLCDAMSGLVYKDDALICTVESKKIFGLNPRIEVEIFKLENSL